ncbi:MAG TPA: FliM/FliN family flagellar motor switch protein [Candidatus Binatia bacterium]|nr:FliM/FliN family flagellar motor switch protein [Candidatus Binatia bacterium]
MEKTLTQAEIDLLFQAAQGARPSKPTPADKRIVTRCDFLQSGRLSKEQAQAVTMLHEGFAPRLSNSLGAYLREGFEARLVSVEQLSYSDFLSRISEMTFFCTIPVKPMDSQAGVQIDMPLVFPMIDLLLGGSGKGQPERQDLTEIEEQIMQSVVAIICRELREAWNSVMAVEFFAGTALKRSQIRTLMASGEKVLTLSFEIVLGETRGMLNLVFPPLAANLLLRKLAQMGATSRSRTSGESTGRLRARLLGCEFPAELLLAHVPATTRELLELSVGQVLPLRVAVQVPPMLSVGGQALFDAAPVSCGNARGALIRQRLTEPPEEEQEGS